MTTDYLKKFGLTAPTKTRNAPLRHSSGSALRPLHGKPRGNPAPRIGTAKPKRPSQATGKAPSKRLVSRRKKNTVKGTFPNPVKKGAHGGSNYVMEVKSPSGLYSYNFWGTKTAAVNAVKRFVKLHPDHEVKLFWFDKPKWQNGRVVES